MSRMVFLTPEQMNATRQSLLNGDWMESVRIVTRPLRSSVRRSIARSVRRPVRRSAEYVDPALVPEFSSNIHSLYVHEVADFELATGLERLFSDVDRQIRGEFRLAGGGYRSVPFDTTDPLSEVEDFHALHRLYWAARYVRAAAFRHPEAIEALRDSWIKWVRMAHGPAAVAPYTLAERIASLSECLFWARHCTDGLNAGEIISMKRQVWKDAHRLSANIEYGLGVHNHLLNDARGLFRASLVLRDLDEAAAWQEQAFSLWDEFFPKLVLEDGSFAEQSSHYQLLLCRTALEYYLAARLLHRVLPEATVGQLSRMFQVANDLLRTDGSLPRFGDNSPDHTIDDLWGLMAAAYHCGLLKARPRHDSISPLTLFYCGQAPRLPDAIPSSCDRFYPQGGFMFLRSRDGSVELAVHADPRPESRAHGSAGRGSFELWRRGNVVVREPGSMLSSSNPRSAWSRSGLGQNVTCLNGLPPGVSAEDRRSLPSSYGNQGGAWPVFRQGALQFRWDGFERIKHGIVLWRTWHLNETEDLSFEEHIAGSGEIQFLSRLCLGDGRWELIQSNSANRAELQCNHQDGSMVSIQWTVPPGVNAALADGCCLPEFGIEKPAQVFVLSGVVKLPIRWTAKWQFCSASREILSEASQPCAG
jgi:hypothetical protein